MFLVVVTTTVVLVCVVLSVPSVLTIEETVVVVVSEASAVTINAVALVAFLEVGGDGREARETATKRDPVFMMIIGGIRVES